MKISFESDRGTISILVEIVLANKKANINLALDTGATATVISAKRLERLGYDLKNPEDEIYITTGSGLVFVPKVKIEKLTALGNTKENFLVVAHDLPPTVSVDGVLGLDFMRGHVLTVDFIQGFIELQ